MTDRKATVGDILARVPTALFPIALGLAGLGAALGAAGARFDNGLAASASAIVLTLAAIVLFTDIFLYAAKLLRASPHARAEFGDATTANLIAPAFMAAMVVGAQASAAGLAISPAGRWLWIAAVSGHLLLLLRFVGRWLTRDYAPGDLNPTWFLPAAGIMTASMTARGFWPEPLTWLAFACGVCLWATLLPLVFRRLVFEPALPPRLRPSLFIVAAPFGLAANSIMNLAPDAPLLLPAVLTYFGGFFILVLIAHPRFIASAGVSLSWWATTFPTATVAVAFLSLSARSGQPLDAAAGLALLAFAAGATSLAIVATGRVAWTTCLGQIEAADEEIAAMRGE